MLEEALEITQSDLLHMETRRQLRMQETSLQSQIPVQTDQKVREEKKEWKRGNEREREREKETENIFFLFFFLTAEVCTF